jgi:hypothetical protein
MRPVTTSLPEPLRRVPSRRKRPVLGEGGVPDALLDDRLPYFVYQCRVHRSPFVVVLTDGGNDRPERGVRTSGGRPFLSRASRVLASAGAS